MLNQESISRSDLINLIEDWYQHELSEVQAEQLKQILRTNASARQIFVEYGDMLASLDICIGTSQRHDVDTFLTNAIRAKTEEKPQWFHKPAAVTLLSVLSLGVLWGALNLAGIPFPNQNLAIQKTVPVATLVDIMVVDSDNHSSQGSFHKTQQFSRDFFSGKRFSNQEPLLLGDEKFFAKLKLDNGVQLLVQGPAHLAFDSDMHVRLLEGKLHGFVPAQATGFTVHLPHGLVRDLGTEFLVAVTDKNSLVTVLSGAVECEITTGSKTRPAIPLKLTSSQNAILDSEIPHPVLQKAPHSEFAKLAAIHSGIVKTTGDVLFSTDTPPLPTVRRPHDVGVIAAYPEKTTVPIFWDNGEKKFRKMLNRQNPQQNDQVTAEITAPFLQNATDDESFEVDSYLINMSSAGSTPIILTGTLTFEHEVLAIICSSKGLLETDSFSLSPDFISTWEERTPAARGSKEKNDQIELNEDGKTINLTLQASGAGDQLRVLVRSRKN